MADDWQPRPARGYSWRKAEPGNALAVTHGAYSPPIVASLADQLIAEVLEERPDLKAPAWRYELSDWATNQSRAAILSFWLDAMGPIDAATKEPRHGWLGEVARFEAAAARGRDRLGLTPASFARLKRDVIAAGLAQADLEGLMAEGRRVRLEAGQLEQAEEAEEEPG